ncbi:Kelch repeat-containing protein [Fusarium oxysporum f. sp. rapae]|uniref:Kelch repeat-containing protein n=1 Tax=Fusarium oxysporum f. sp. rapae TaxID=485398 RepID=A0A8J5TS76_FUSOX|nr:Kelch repeat-containing protein [Fusarium oxysporum f. sp. rapae]
MRWPTGKLTVVSCLASLCRAAKIETRQRTKGSTQLPANDDFLRRSGLSVAVLDDYVYIEGGEVNSELDESRSTAVSLTLSIPLEESWTNDTVVFMESEKGPAPYLKQPALWIDEERSVIYSWGGQGSYKNTSAAGDHHLYAFEADDVKGSWSTHDPEDDTLFSSLYRTVRGAYTTCHGAGYYLGGYGESRTDERFTDGSYVERPLDGLLTYNFTTEKWTNDSTKALDYATWSGRATCIPSIGASGLLVFMGGAKVKMPAFRNASEPVSFTNITSFDPSSKAWYYQRTSGVSPDPRIDFCSMGVQGQNNTYEIFIYGGWNIWNDKTKAFGDVWVLSLPAFKWFKADIDGPKRGMHGCALIGKRQMVSIGGNNWGKDEGWIDKDPWTQGIGILDLPSMAWSSEYDADAENDNTNFIPTRVLDVGRTDTDLVKLVEPAERVKYVALSHCWGTSEPFTTTYATIGDRKAGFPFELNIPKTFQDAIKVTRKLGVRYLWIDSLCIIQGDVADWEREASRMAGVYRSAFLTIGALNASDDQEGFLTYRKLPDWELNVLATGSDEKSTHVYLRRREDRYIVPAKFPLDTRSWTLQEKYLKRDAKNKNPLIIRDHQNGTPVLSLLRSRIIERVFSEWYHMIKDYSTRKLSVDTDRLPALTGLASYLAGHCDRNYCADMWWQDISQVFCWRPSTIARVPHRYIALSWSWASLICYVEFPFGFYDLQDHWLDSTKPLSSVRYLDYYLQTKGPDKFGQLSRGWLLVEGIAVGLVEMNQGGETKQNFRLQCIADMHTATVEFDLGQPKNNQALGLLLMRSEPSEYSKELYPDTIRLLGLIIEEPGE